MTQLFTLPKQIPLTSTGGLMSGAKLYFYQTATTTPQNTYQDIALTVPHANPVVADGNGVFPPIYMDASLPDYRVKLTTSADVQIWQLDDIPAGQDTGQTYRLVSAAPEIIFEETDASSGNKNWRIRVNTEQLTLDVGNDAESVWANVLTVDRSGTTVDSVKLKGNELAVKTSGSFTATLTGVSGTVTGTIFWKRVGDLVFLYVTSNLIGTSNATSKTITGVPADLRPTNTKACPCTLIEDSNGGGGVAQISSSGVITLLLGADQPNAIGFDDTPEEGGTGLPANWQICYVID